MVSAMLDMYAAALADLFTNRAFQLVLMIYVAAAISRSAPLLLIFVNWRSKRWRQRHRLGPDGTWVRVRTSAP